MSCRVFSRSPPLPGASCCGPGCLRLPMVPARPQGRLVEFLRPPPPPAQALGRQRHPRVPQPAPPSLTMMKLQPKLTPNTNSNPKSNQSQTQTQNQTQIQIKHNSIIKFQSIPKLNPTGWLSGLAAKLPKPPLPLCSAVPCDVGLPRLARAAAWRLTCVEATPPAACCGPGEGSAVCRDRQPHEARQVSSPSWLDACPACSRSPALRGAACRSRRPGCSRLP